MKPYYCKFYNEAFDFRHALGYAYEALVNGPYKFDAATVWTRLSERVSQGIYMGEGLLLPHTGVAQMPAPLMTFAVAPKGFTGVNISRNEKAFFMCLLLFPLESAAVHTQAISEVAKLLLNKEWTAKALTCTDDSQVAALF